MRERASRVEALEQEVTRYKDKMVDIDNLIESISIYSIYSTITTDHLSH